MKNKRCFFIILVIALLIKFSLFIYAEAYAPEAKFQFDTKMYLESGLNLATHGIFARQDTKGNFTYETFRTPGFPLFLGVLRGLMKIPFSGIILTQIFLTILVAFITYKAAATFDPRLGYLSAVIVLFDPPVTIFSLMLLSETLF
ncbi:MAG: hypothetical protein H8E13_10530, partial [Actinobacteria bacterium]|nr:hypothetical protein [Actinomycetota bacterium]